MAKIRPGRLGDRLIVDPPTLDVAQVLFLDPCPEDAGGSGGSGGSGSGGDPLGGLVCRRPLRKRLVDFVFKQYLVGEELVWVMYPAYAWTPPPMAVEGSGALGSGGAALPECNPPWGVERELVLEWSGLPPECHDDPCPTSTLSYDEGDEVWRGELALKGGTLEVELFCYFMEDPDTGVLYPRWGVTVEGCYGSGGAQVGITCPSPFRMSMSGLAIGTGNPCCEDFDGVAYLGFTVKGPNRFSAARLADFEGAGGADVKPVFAKPQACAESDPCGVPPGCCPGVTIPDTVTLTVIGGCFAGVYSLAKDPSGTYWVGELPAVGSGGTGDSPVRAACTSVGGSWRWSIVGTSPPFCGFGAFANVYECDPLEVVFEDVEVYGCCVPLPGFVTVTMIITL